MDRSLAASLLAVPARPALYAIAAWLALALVVALSEAITMERRFAVPIVLASLVALLVALYRRGGALRALADGLDARTLVLFHVVRAPIGVAFLVLMGQGLDGTFARIAGVGDLISGGLALAVGLFAVRSRGLVLAWNAIGLADILLVVFTAQRILIFSDHPGTMAILVHFPGMLLPTFLVPLVIATHVLLFARLRTAAPAGSA